jgi:fructokinase
MNSAPDITCVGELLVDFLSERRGVSLEEAPLFRKHAGGAPANVAVGLAKLGVRSAFVGKVGEDSFGRFLSGRLRREGVDVSGLTFHSGRRTRLAFVSLTSAGERDFEFWERRPADEQLRMSDIPLRKILRSKIVHISSFLLLKEPARSTALALARKVRQAGRWVSFDPNLRLPLWSSPGAARRVLLRMVRVSSILRLNAREAQFLTGMSDPERSARKLRSMGPSIVVITLGAGGCYAQTAGCVYRMRGYRVKVVDTTGCGDGFLAGMLYGILRAEEDLASLPLRAVVALSEYGNAVGALTATGYGALSALPSIARVNRFIARQRRHRD